MSMNMNSVVPAQAAEPPRGWWSKNWKWFVPVSLLGLALICCGVVGFGINKLVSGLTTSEPALLAIKAVMEDPQVKQALGDDVRPNSLVAGSLSIDNDRGEAQLNFDLVGSKGTAKVIVKGQRVGGKWALPSVLVNLPDGKQIKVKTTGVSGAPEDDNVAPPWPPTK